MEGYMDVIMSFQHGIDYTVAGMGTALPGSRPGLSCSLPVRFT